MLESINTSSINNDINNDLFASFHKHKPQKQTIGNGSTQPNVISHTKHHKDIYTETPIRYLGFTNEVGAAVAPLFGHFGEMITYGPALGYIAMDVRDKFRRGDDNSYQEPSHKRATKQLIFQMMASVILPTAAVKAAQIAAGKVIDKMPNLKNKIKTFVADRKNLANLIDKCKDNHANSGSMLDDIAHGFQKIINVITILPMFIKTPEGKSGLRNIGLAVVGLTALAAAIKPIDKFTEHFIIRKTVEPILYIKTKEDK